MRSEVGRNDMVFVVEKDLRRALYEFWLRIKRIMGCGLSEIIV